MFKGQRLFTFRFSEPSNGRIRFTALGLTGFIAVRKYKSRGYGTEHQRCFTQFHFGRYSVGIEKAVPERMLWNFSG